MQCRNAGMLVMLVMLVMLTMETMQVTGETALQFQRCRKTCTNK